MASTSLIVVLIGLLALSLSISANARPCRTTLISYSVSFRRAGDHFFSADRISSSGIITTFAEVRSIPVYIIRNNDNSNSKPSFETEIFFDRALPGHEDHSVEDEVEIEHRAPQIMPSFGFSSYDFSLLRDRTKDILSVVVALLFGVGCGALTATTMYLVWSMFSNRYDYRSYGDFVDDEEDEIQSPKKMGYVNIPASESLPAPAKEGV